MNKKSQGLSINLIIIVAIALIVLVVVIAIFTGRMGGFVGGLGESKTCQGACEGIGLPTSAGSDDVAGCSGKTLPGKYSDVPDKVCCCS